MPIPNFAEFLDKVFEGEALALAQWVDYAKKKAFSLEERKIIAERLKELDIFAEDKERLYLNLYLINAWKEYEPFPSYENIAKAYEQIVEKTGNPSAMNSLASLYLSGHLKPPPKSYAEGFLSQQLEAERTAFAKYRPKKEALDFENFKKDNPSAFRNEEEARKAFKKEKHDKEMKSFSEVAINKRVGRERTKEFEQFKYNKEFAEFKREKKAESFDTFKAKAVRGKPKTEAEYLESFQTAVENELFIYDEKTEPEDEAYARFKKEQKEQAFIDFKLGKIPSLSETAIREQFVIKTQADEYAKFKAAKDEKKFVVKSGESDVKAFIRFKKENHKKEQEAFVSSGNFMIMQQFGGPNNVKQAFKIYKKELEEKAFVQFKDEAVMEAFKVSTAKEEANDIAAFRKVQEPKDQEQFKHESQAKAFELYKRAAELGNPQAKLNLAHMYFKGIGTEKSEAEAFKLYKEVIDLKDAEALFNLASMYFDGLVTERSEDEAQKFYKLAAGLNHPEAREKVQAYNKEANAASKALVLEKLKDFEGYLQEKYKDEPSKDYLIKPFMTRARGICEEQALKEDKEAYVSKVCSKLDKLAKHSFKHQNDVLRNFADKVLKFFNYISSDRASTLKEKLTGSKTFEGSPTKRQQTLRDMLRGFTKDDNKEKDKDNKPNLQP